MGEREAGKKGSGVVKFSGGVRGDGDIDVHGVVAMEMWRSRSRCGDGDVAVSVAMGLRR